MSKTRFFNIIKYVCRWFDLYVNSTDDSGTQAVELKVVDCTRFVSIRLYTMGNIPSIIRRRVPGFACSGWEYVCQKTHQIFLIIPEICLYYIVLILSNTCPSNCLLEDTTKVKLKLIYWLGLYIDIAWNVGAYVWHTNSNSVQRLW